MKKRNGDPPFQGKREKVMQGGWGGSESRSVRSRGEQRLNFLSFLWLTEKIGIDVGWGEVWGVGVYEQCYAGGGTLQTTALIVPINLPCLCSYAGWLRVWGVVGVARA